MTKTLYTEIINVLKREAASAPLVSISEEVLAEFKQAGSPPMQPPAVQPVPTAQQPLPSAKQPARPATSIVDSPFNQQPPAAAPVPPPDMSSWTMDQLQQAATSCTACGLCRGRTNVVFGEGNTNADLMFIGEGPGLDEDAQGRPFVGKAGQLLTKMIEAMQFSRQDVYIANIVKCRPPNNRNPEPGEVQACLPYLIRQIQLIQPKVLVLLGAVPLLALCNKTGISRQHGNWQNVMGIQTMPTFHPAYLLRYSTAKRDAWQDLQKVMAVFGKNAATKSAQ